MSTNHGGHYQPNILPVSAVLPDGYASDVARLNSKVADQNGILSQTRSLAAESARRLEAEEANRIYCQGVIGDADFRRMNGC